MDKDQGQMVMVVQQTKSIVVVRWKDELMGEPRAEKLKRPESLIQLEGGLVLEHDAHGMLWIQRVREKNKENRETVTVRENEMFPIKLSVGCPLPLNSIPRGRGGH
jgi:hypothetical protein